MLSHQAGCYRATVTVRVSQEQHQKKGQRGFELHASLLGSQELSVPDVMLLLLTGWMLWTRQAGGD